MYKQLSMRGEGPGGQTCVPRSSYTTTSASRRSLAALTCKTALGRMSFLLHVAANHQSCDTRGAEGNKASNFCVQKVVGKGEAARTVMSSGSPGPEPTIKHLPGEAAFLLLDSPGPELSVKRLLGVAALLPLALERLAGHI